jgi:hypothetical protein
MKYKYNGPASGVTLADGTEKMLYDGEEVELPAENEYTKTLVALGKLTEIAQLNTVKTARKTSEATNAS